MDVVTYPCWDKRLTTLLKGVHGNDTIASVPVIYPPHPHPHTHHHPRPMLADIARETAHDLLSIVP